MENYSVKEGKTIAIISYITFIGTIIAFIMNQNKKNAFAAFHIRQAIGIILLGFAVSFVDSYINSSFIDALLGMGVFVLWVMGLISAIQGEEKRIPLLGDQFQDWFKNIG